MIKDWCGNFYGSQLRDVFRTPPFSLPSFPFCTVSILLGNPSRQLLTELLSPHPLPVLPGCHSGTLALQSQLPDTSQRLAVLPSTATLWLWLRKRKEDFCAWWQMMTFQEAESWSTWRSNYSPQSCGLDRLFCFLFHGGKWIWETRCVPRCLLNKFVSPCFCLSCVCHTQLLLCEEEGGWLCSGLIQRCRRKWNPYTERLWAASLSQAGFLGTCVGRLSSAYINLTSTCDLYFQSLPSLCSMLLV